MDSASPRTARLYRMVRDKHLCPWGLKAKALLEREGYEVEDHHLTSREETEAFKDEHGVRTTPQVFLGPRRIGGYEDLRAYLGDPVPDPDATTYTPVIAIFAMTALMALGLVWRMAPPDGAIIRWLETFVALSMCVLAILKLRDLEGFSTMFLGYDLLARRWVRYGHVYPFAEAFAGVAMLGGVLTWLAAPVAVFIGLVGAASVIKAVYVDKRELKCACVGGDTNVPLGFVSLTENLMMLGMGVWMGARAVF
ncbi:MauE/DoxX family redox-associated membrane protein [Maricaulis sp. CAU 1757]